MKEKILFLNFLALCFLLSSCGKFCGKDRDVDAITVALAQPIEVLDPRFSTSAAASRVSSLIFASLFSLASDGLPKPLLAKSWTQTEKKLVITLHDNLFFHDGSSLTAEDVAYTYNELDSDDVVSPYQGKFPYIEKIETPDKKTVVFHLNKPFAPLLTDLSAMGIVSKFHCKNKTKQCKEKLVGSGPFRLKRWDKVKEEILLEPFDRWFKSPPKTSVLLRVVRDENTRLLELMSQKTLLVDSDISSQNLKDIVNKNFLHVQTIPGLGYRYLAINVRGDKAQTHNSRTMKALGNKKVRKAIGLAINTDHIIEKIFHGKAKRVSGLIPNSNWAKSPNLPALPFDPNKAEALLDEAGFKKNKQTGIRFNVNLLTSQDRTAQSLAVLNANFLRKVGIGVTLKVKDWSALYQDMKQGNFEMFSAIWVPITDPDMYTWVHHSKSIPGPNVFGGNRHGYRNKKVDALIDKGQMTLDPVKRKEIYFEVEKLLLKDLPYIPLWNEDRIIVINQRVKNYVPSSTGSLKGLVNAYLE